MATSNSDIICSSTIYAHTPCTIFLRNQNNRNDTRAKTNTNIPSVQKRLHLLLNLLRRLGIGCNSPDFTKINIFVFGVNCLFVCFFWGVFIPDLSIDDSPPPPSYLVLDG